MIKVVSWNIARRRKPLYELREMDADVALLQEVGPGMAVSLPAGMETGSRAHWDSYRWCSNPSEEGFSAWCNRWPMVVKLSDRVEVEWFEQVGPSSKPMKNEFRVSDIGLISAARVTPKDRKDGEPFIAVSMYASWNPIDGSTNSARSIVSDLSALIDRGVKSSHRILAAGDLNKWYEPGAYKDMRAEALVEDVPGEFGYFYHIYLENNLYTVVGYRPNGDAFYIRRRNWKTLWGTRRWIQRNIKANAELRHMVTSGEAELVPGVWSRMNALGFEFMGPQYPNGRQADPVPDFMPSDTKNVVTFRRPGQAAQDADQQLDYVFASHGFHQSVTTRALNSVEEWGASDHCRLMIEVVPD